MVVGGVSKYGVGKLNFFIRTVYSYAYKQAIVNYLNDIKYLGGFNRDLYFQQDNAPSHTSRDIKEILINIKILNFCLQIHPK